MNYTNLAKRYVDSWLSIQKNQLNDYPDEADESREIIENNAIAGLKLVVELIKLGETIEDTDLKYKWIFYIAAGDLENLIKLHGEVIIDQVVEEMGNNDLFLIACTGVWPLGRDINDPVWKAFQVNLAYAIKNNQTVLEILKSLKYEL